MENLDSALFALGGCAVLAAWIVSYVLIVNDKNAGPRRTAVSDEATTTDARELVSASSD